MYVRLAFAVAAHLEPEIPLVDEVLAVGDAVFQKKCPGKAGKRGDSKAIGLSRHGKAGKVCDYMNAQDLVRLVRKYYGYVADLEGSGVEALDLLFVRDNIQRILDKSGPEEQMPLAAFEQIYELDRVLWAESDTFRMVVGDKELQHARQQQRSPRSHWWWYLDELKTLPQPIQPRRDPSTPVFVPA